MKRPTRAYPRKGVVPIHVSLIVLTLVLGAVPLYFGSCAQRTRGVSTVPGERDADDSSDGGTKGHTKHGGDDSGLTRYPEPLPEEGPSIGTFDSIILDDGICADDEGRPIIRLFTTTWCSHCKWVGPAFDEIMTEYVDAGKICAYHWELDTGDNSLTEKIETEVPDSELAIFRQFNPKGFVPTFIFGCKYYRVGTGYEYEDDLENEKEEFKAIIKALISEMADIRCLSRR